MPLSVFFFFKSRATPRYVGQSVGQSVDRSVCPLFTISAFLSFLRLLLLPRCPSDLLQHCSCPPACDWGSRVSGLVYFCLSYHMHPFVIYVIYSFLCMAHLIPQFSRVLFYSPLSKDSFHFPRPYTLSNI